MSWEMAVVSVLGHLCFPCHQSWAFQEGQKHWSGVEALGRGEMGCRKRGGYEGKSLGMFQQGLGKVAGLGTQFWGADPMQCRDPCNEEEPRQTRL